MLQVGMKDTFDDAVSLGLYINLDHVSRVTARIFTKIEPDLILTWKRGLGIPRPEFGSPKVQEGPLRSFNGHSGPSYPMGHPSLRERKLD